MVVMYGRFVSQGVFRVLSTPWRVASFFGSVLSLILAVPLFISLCVHHLRKRHMMGLLPILYMFSVTPRGLVFKKKKTHVVPIANGLRQCPRCIFQIAWSLASPCSCHGVAHCAHFRC